MGKRKENSTQTQGKWFEKLTEKVKSRFQFDQSSNVLNGTEKSNAIRRKIVNDGKNKFAFKDRSKVTSLDRLLQNLYKFVRN